MSPENDSVLDGHDAFLALHQHAGNVPEETMGIARVSVGEALQALDSDAAVPDSARLELLTSLARAGFPGEDHASADYQQLAARIGQPAGLSGDQVLADVKAHVSGTTPFLASTTGGALPHATTAFYEQDLCNTYRVEVDGKGAVWLFGEFETDAPFESVAQWVDPRNWPKRSPMVFKSMQPVDGGISSLPGVENADSWHGEFHEVVDLAKELNTILHCDFSKVDGVFAASTYELTRSLDKEIDVDRGFLLVNDLGQTRHVKCLKVVGFTNDYWDDQALQWACLTWTHFIRSAVEEGTTSKPRDPAPPPGSSNYNKILHQWIQMAVDAGRRYAAMGSDWVDRAATGYSFDDAVQDTASLWLALARDWSNATAQAFADLQALSTGAGDAADVTDSDFISKWFGSAGAPQSAPAPVTLGAGVNPSVVGTSFGSGKPGFEGTTLPVEGLQPGDKLEGTGLTRLGAQGTQVPAADVTLATVDLGDGWSAIHATMPVQNALPGLYMGKVTINDKRTQDIQVYVSRATGAGA